MSVAAFTFRIHLAPRTFGFRLLRFTLRFQTPHLFFFLFCVTAVHEGSDVISSSSSRIQNSLFPYHLPWKTSTIQRTWCLEGQSNVSPLSTLPIFATFSLFPFRFHIVTGCAFSVRVPRLLSTFSLPTPSSPRRSFHIFSVALICNPLLSSTRPARTSFLSLGSFTSCIRS